MNLRDIVRRHRRGIALALALVVIENVAWMAEPSLFGPLLDQLIARSQGEPEAAVLPPLLGWIGLYILNSVAGSFRRTVDARIFGEAITDISEQVIRRARDAGVDGSTAAGRLALCEEYVTFMQYRVPDILEHSIAIGGAVVGLAIFDYRISLICLIVVAPLLIIRRAYDRRVVALQSILHAGQEAAIDIGRSLNPEAVRVHFQSLALPRRQIARYSALTFVGLRGVLLVIFLAVLYVAIDLDDFTTGHLYSIVSYLWTFITSTEYVPELLESWSSLKEISRRVQTESA